MSVGMHYISSPQRVSAVMFKRVFELLYFGWLVLGGVIELLARAQTSHIYTALMLPMLDPDPDTPCLLDQAHQYITVCAAI